MLRPTTATTAHSRVSKQHDLHQVSVFTWVSVVWPLSETLVISTRFSSPIQYLLLTIIFPDHTFQVFCQVFASDLHTQWHPASTQRADKGCSQEGLQLLPTSGGRGQGFDLLDPTKTTYSCLTQLSQFKDADTSYDEREGMEIVNIRFLGKKLSQTGSFTSLQHIGLH